MGLFSGLETSVSGLTAQRLRLDLIANNIANINTTRTSATTPAGNAIPYRRQTAVLQPRPLQNGFADIFAQNMGNKAGNGVQVSQIAGDKTPFALQYNPDSPDAAKVAEPGVPVGYVRLSNVNIVNEMVDMMGASRAYEANVTVLNASKSMAMKALEIGRG